MVTKQLVAPKDIENELLKIADALQGKNKMRSCLFNLIIYCKSQKRIEYLQSVAQRVVKRFPCRILFLTSDSSSTQNKMSSSVSVIAAEGESSPVFCDFIQIDLLGKDSEKAHSLILPHILPDLPLYLVWGEDPRENTTLLFSLEKYASKTIFDSETAASLTDFANDVFLHHEKTSSAIIDLNWARIEGWRNLIASHFYCEERVSFIKEASKIVISYNEKPIQALYLSCWIAACLDLNFKSVFELKKESSDKVRPGRVLSIAIENAKGESFHFSRAEKSPHIINIRHSLATYCEVPSQYLIEKEESGQSLTSEIFHTGTSLHFMKTLKVLLQIGRPI